MARILVDLDDTLSAHLRALLTALERDLGRRFTISSVTSWDLTECLNVPYQALHGVWTQLGFFRQVTPLPGAMDGMRRLRDLGHDVVIVTAAHSETYVDKVAWVQEHLPWFDTRNIVLCHRKELVSGDVLFDDGPHNVVSWQEAHPQGRAVLMDMPYNRHLRGMARARGWGSFLAFLEALQTVGA